MTRATRSSSAELSEPVRAALDEAVRLVESLLDELIGRTEHEGGAAS